MTADTPRTVETVATEGGEAYISPMADFLVISLFVVVLAVAAGAVILP